MLYRTTHKCFLLTATGEFSPVAVLLLPFTRHLCNNFTMLFVQHRAVQKLLHKIPTLVDMSPNISATNANILMESDFFIVPCAPDYFCYMATDSLTKVFPRWDRVYSQIKENDVFKSADYKMNSGKPQFIGTIQQRYRPRNGSPAKAFSEWIDDINMLVRNKLVPVLKKCNMIVTYDSCNYDETYNLINIADFNSLIAQSQSNNTPVFLLTQEQVQKSGSV